MIACEGGVDGENVVAARYRVWPSTDPIARFSIARWEGIDGMTTVTSVIGDPRSGQSTPHAEWAGTTAAAVTQR